MGGRGVATKNFGTSPRTERRRRAVARMAEGGGGSTKAASDDNFAFKEMSREAAVMAIRKGIPERYLDGWFRNADKDYKPRIVEYLTKVPELRNAAMNIYHQEYQIQANRKVSFKEFINTPIPLYRAGKIAADEPFSSFSVDKKVAVKFSNGRVVRSLVKPRNTLGMLQTIAEGEVLVPIGRISGRIQRVAEVKAKRNPTGNRLTVVERARRSTSLFVKAPKKWENNEKIFK